MEKIVIPLLILGFAFVALQNQVVEPGPAVNAPSTSPPAAAHLDWRSGDQVRGSGTVTRVLSDDNDGSRHQRFIVEVSPGRTVLIAHNIDLAPRVQSIRAGDTVSFHGEYEWNDRGGVIHWTHHDPRGSHPGGWIEHNGRRYE